MMQKEILNTSLAAVGEDIGPELGAKMVKDFQDNYPNEKKWFYCGKEILSQLLNQPDCQGIRFYSALNESGNKTYVMVGIDSQDEIISEFSTIASDGTLVKQTAIVADRVRQPGGGGVKDTGTSTTSLDWWS